MPKYKIKITDAVCTGQQSVKLKLPAATLEFVRPNQIEHEAEVPEDVIKTLSGYQVTPVGAAAPKKKPAAPAEEVKGEEDSK